MSQSGADTPARMPWVSLGVGALWIVAALASAAGAWTVERFGLQPAGLTLGGVLGFATLHTGIAHLALSLLWLAAAGPALERRWGSGFFAAFFVSAIALQAIVDGAFPADPGRVLVGTSAAAAALLAAATLRFWRGGIPLPLPDGRSIALPALALPLLWFFGEVALDALEGLGGATRGVGYRADLAAMGLGFGTAAVLASGGREKLWLHRRRRLAREREARALVDRARALREEERFDSAWGLLAPALAESGADPRLAIALLQLGSECDRRDEAIAAATRFVEQGWRHDERDAALEVWCAVVAQRAEAPLDLALRYAIAPALDEIGKRREAALTLRAALHGTPLSPGAALRIAQLARGIHAETAIEAARCALTSDAIDAAKRERIEKLIAALEADPTQLEDLELDAPIPGRAPAETTAPAAPHGADSEPEDPSAIELAPESDSDPMELAEAPDPDALADSEPEDPYALALDPGDTGDAGDSTNAEDPAVDPDLDLDALGIGSDWSLPRFAESKQIDAIPIELGESGLRLSSSGGAQSSLSYARIEAISAATLDDLGPTPVTVVDLLLNWRDPADGEPLKIARLRSDGLDGGAWSAEADPLAALAALAEALLERSGAEAVPGSDAVCGRPFPHFDENHRYLREVLGVDA